MNRWDLTDLYPDVSAMEADLEALKLKAEQFSETYRGRITDALPPSELEAIIAAYEEIDQQTQRIYSYVDLSRLANLKDEALSQLYARVMEQIVTLSEQLVFFTLDLNQLSHPFPTRYDAWVKRVQTFKPHQLPEALEILDQQKQLTGEQAWIRLYDQLLAGLTFTFQGKTCGLSEVLDGMSHADPETRSQAAHALHNGLAPHSKTFAFIFNTLIQDKRISDNNRHYATPMQSRHLSNQIEPEVVETMVATIKEAYPRLCHRYYQYKAQQLGQESIQYWDRNAPLFVQEEPKIAYEEAKEIVYAAYEAFSPALASYIRPFYDRPWIDVPALDTKTSGAFSYPTPVHPYILLNYQGSLRDVMTLAHELGHGAHQCLAQEQGWLLSQTPLTLAETASVFGESLTFDYLQQQRPSKALIASKLDDMMNTVFRQIAFYTFEQKVHQAQRELSVQELNTLWHETQHEALGPAVALSDVSAHFWSYISHFYHAPFYVYAYAFGDGLVNTLFQLYQETDDRKAFEANYLDLLRAGGAKDYRTVLQPFGLDPTKKSFWELGLRRIEQLMDSLTSM